MTSAEVIKGLVESRRSYKAVDSEDDVITAAISLLARVEALCHGAAMEHRKWVGLDELRRALKGEP